MTELDELARLRRSAEEGWDRARYLDAEVRRLHGELAAERELSQRLNADLQVHVRQLADAAYHADGLAVWDQALPFLADPRFREAYRTGMSSGHHIGRARGASDDIHVEWRVHVVLWAAQLATRLAGDYVECGVNTGMYSLAVCKYLDFTSLDRDFWLFDTYAGIPLTQAHETERDKAIADNASNYDECFGLAQGNFAPYPRAHLVRGTVPDSLTSVKIERVAYLSIDMNLAAPERAALEYFWPELAHGAVVVLDDYGWARRPLQRESADAFATSVGVPILALPTGQGIVVKT